MLQYTVIKILVDDYLVKTRLNGESSLIGNILIFGKPNWPLSKNCERNN